MRLNQKIFLLILTVQVVNIHATSLKKAHIKAGIYTNGKCIVIVEQDKQGNPFVEIVMASDKRAKLCDSDVDKDCGDIQIPIRPRITDRGVNDFSLYPRKVVEKNFQRKSDGAIEVTFESKEQNALIFNIHHSQLSLTLNAHGQVTDAAGMWALAEGRFSGLKIYSRVVDRCKGLKEDSPADQSDLPKPNNPSSKQDVKISR